MPYEVMKSGDKFKVVKKGSKKVMGTHATRDKANKQLAALYASEGKEVRSG